MIGQKNLVRRVLKPLVFLACLGPLGYLTWGAFTGNLTAERFIGGLVGYMAENSIILDSYATGDLTAPNRNWCGGLRGADPGGQVGDARAFRRGDDGGAVQRPGVAVGHERGALLVAGEDEPDLRGGAQHIEDRQVHRARYAEHVVDSLPAEAIDNRLRTCNHGNLSKADVPIEILLLMPSSA